MNLWTAMKEIVALFVDGGRPGYALIALLAILATIVLVANGAAQGSRVLLEGLVVGKASSALASLRR